MRHIIIAIFLYASLNCVPGGEIDYIKANFGLRKLKPTRVRRQLSISAGGIHAIVPTAVPLIPVPENHIHHHHINHVVVHKGNAALSKIGTPIERKEVRFPNGTKKIFTLSHLLHTDITESFPPYLSGFRSPLHPQHPYIVHPEHTYGQYANHHRYGYNVPPIPRVHHLPTLNYEHHHHHALGTYHHAFEAFVRNK